MNKKICTKCNIEKELHCFDKQKTGKFGFRADCKYCLKEYIRLNKDRLLLNAEKRNIILIEENPNLKKVCTNCNLNKELNEFHKQKNGKFGVTNKCKDCSKKCYVKNKKIILEKRKEYRKNNKEKIKEYRENNKEKYKEYNKEYNKEWYKKNKDSISESVKVWKESNKDKVKIYKKKWNYNNKEYRKKYEKQRRNTDQLYNFTCNIRSFIYKALKKGSCKKNSKAETILGCSFEELKTYIENKFEPWMTWDNYGKYNGELNFGWDIDHIIPVSIAKSEIEIIKLNHYTNMQPLCSKVNRHIKRNKINLD